MARNWDKPALRKAFNTTAGIETAAPKQAAPDVVIVDSTGVPQPPSLLQQRGRISAVEILGLLLLAATVLLGIVQMALAESTEITKEKITSTDSEREPNKKPPQECGKICGPGQGGGAGGVQSASVSSGSASKGLQSPKTTKQERKTNPLAGVVMGDPTTYPGYSGPTPSGKPGSVSGITQAKDKRSTTPRGATTARDSLSKTPGGNQSTNSKRQPTSGKTNTRGANGVSGRGSEKLEG